MFRVVLCAIMAGNLLVMLLTYRVSQFNIAEELKHTERANLNFDILYKDFDAILSKISKF